MRSRTSLKRKCDRLKKLRYLATVAFVGRLVTGGSDGSPQAKRSLYLERAKRCYDSGELDMAEIEYRNVLRIDPMQPLAIRRLGVIDQDQGKGDWALSFWERSPIGVETMRKPSSF